MLDHGAQLFPLGVQRSLLALQLLAAAPGLVQQPLAFLVGARSLGDVLEHGGEAVRRKGEGGDAEVTRDRREVRLERDALAGRHQRELIEIRRRVVPIGLAGASAATPPAGSPSGARRRGSHRGCDSRWLVHPLRAARAAPRPPSCSRTASESTLAVDERLKNSSCSSSLRLRSSMSRRKKLAPDAVG